MDANNFKNVFKNMFLNKKRDKEEKDSANPDISTQNELEAQNSINKNPKRYVKYSDIMEQKIKENNKMGDILKKFDNLDNNNQTDVIAKVAEMQKHKKQFEEDNKKYSQLNESKKGKEKSVDNTQSEVQKTNLDLDEKSNADNKDDENTKNMASNINVYSSDSEPDDNENEKFTENIASIPKEFDLEVCNKEWVVDVDSKKYLLKLILE